MAKAIALTVQEAAKYFHVGDTKPGKQIDKKVSAILKIQISYVDYEPNL